MFQAIIKPAKTFKQIIESLKEVVNECTFECTQSQMQVQAMDSGHVSLVSLELIGNQFYQYRCERNLQLGVNIGSLSKMMKCSAGDDSVTLTAADGGDVLNIKLADELEERVSDFSMKLMEIDSDALGIPQQDYKAAVTMPSAEFAKICRDIANFGDNVQVEVTEDSVAFSASGEIGTGKVVLKANKHIDSVKQERAVKAESGVKSEPGVKSEFGVKDEPTEGKRKVKTEQGEDEPATKKRKLANGGAKDKVVKSDGVTITCEEPVTLQFALRYLTMFSKAQAVSDNVSLMLAKDVPLQVEFEINGAKDAQPDEAGVQHKLGYLRYYLAPKVGDGDDDADGDDMED